MTNAEKVRVWNQEVNGSDATDRKRFRKRSTAVPIFCYRRSTRHVSTSVRSHPPTTAAAAGALAALAALLSPAPPASATVDVLADRDVTLSRQRQVVQTQGGNLLELGGTTYRISYQGGDGNDVVLTAVGPAGHAPSAGPQSGAVTGGGPRTADTAGVLGWWPYVLAVGLLVGLVMPTATRRGRRTGGRHAAHG